MAGKKGGLGAGLSALIADNAMDAGAENATMLSLNEIEPNRDQPRKTFSEEALLDLSESIKQHGVLQPLLVRPMPDGSYRLIAGERRWRASRMAGLTEVPVTIREMSDEEESIFALIENLQREDLNAIEEAEGLKTLIENFGLTQEQAAQRVGKSRTAVTNALRLLNLPKSVAELLKDGKISMGHARALLSIADAKAMEALAQRVAKEGLSVREVERMAKRLENQDKPKAEKRSKKRDKFYDEAELALSKELSRKVKIFNSRGGRGTLEIEFFNKEDLQKFMLQIENME